METCPTENAIGVRNNPVCVDGVDVSRFENITSVDALNPLSVATTGSRVAVSLYQPAKIVHVVQ